MEHYISDSRASRIGGGARTRASATAKVFLSRGRLKDEDVWCLYSAFQHVLMSDVLQNMSLGLYLQRSAKKSNDGIADCQLCATPPSKAGCPGVSGRHSLTSEVALLLPL